MFRREHRRWHLGTQQLVTGQQHRGTMIALHKQFRGRKCADHDACSSFAWVKPTMVFTPTNQVRYTTGNTLHLRCIITVIETLFTGFDCALVPRVVARIDPVQHRMIKFQHGSGIPSRQEINARCIYSVKQAIGSHQVLSSSICVQNRALSFLMNR